jgi:hypothetical protein
MEELGIKEFRTHPTPFSDKVTDHNKVQLQSSLSFHYIKLSSSVCKISYFIQEYLTVFNEDLFSIYMLSCTT